MTETQMTAKAHMDNGSEIRIDAIREFEYQSGSRFGEVVLYQIREARTGRWISAANVTNLTY